MKRTLIQNAVIVNEGRKVLGSVVIENEKIAEILVGEEKATAPCDEVIDASGCYLLRVIRAVGALQDRKSVV